VAGKEKDGMKVYIITSGSYSDYGIHGVSLSKKKARAAIDKAKAADEYWACDADIEEWEADEVLQRENQTYWACGMLLDDGSVVEPRAEGYQSTIFDKPFRSRIEQYGVKVPFYNNRPIVRTRSTVSAKHALKVAVEARQKWLREKAEKP
jgi:hypothetical protein